MNVSGNWQLKPGVPSLIHSDSQFLLHSIRVYHVVSLVPRPFPPPVFDCILYAKTEGEGLGERVTYVTSGRREGRHTGGGA